MRYLIMTLAAGLALAAGVAGASEPGGTWQTWGTETYLLEPGESMQFRVAYEQIPVRAWRLVVDGDQILSDLHVLRLRDESLLYFERDESRHEVRVPWGQGEEIAVVLTAGRAGGVQTVTFLGPPADAALASYSYGVNRALEAYAAGRQTEAEALCQQALRDDPRDGVARVLLADFLRDRRFYERAADLVAEALALDLPDDMRELARQLQAELEKLHTPLPRPLREQLAAAEQELAADRAETALARCRTLLTEQRDLGAEARSQILRLCGRALHRLARNFEAIDAFTQALTFTRSREQQAVIYYRMGRLFLDMENPTQAEGAFNVARKYGLPAGLDLQAAEALQGIARDKQ